jgi:hypothetical protein
MGVMASVHAYQQQQPGRDDCLGRTCMKWSPSGELSDLDRHLILERLAQADSSVSVIGPCSLDEQP